MNNLRLLPQEASKERIVDLLRGVLEKAEAGEVQGIFMFVEDSDGGIAHHRDGVADNQVIFSIELIKKRILGKYA